VSDIKEMLVAAVIGRGMLSTTDAAMLEEKQLAKFCGEDDWEWDKQALEKLDAEELFVLFNRPE